MFIALWFLLNRAESSAINNVGQTAKDIAEFWLHDEVVAELSYQPQLMSAVAADTMAREHSNYFCNSPLDRASHLRTDTAWLNDASTSSNTVYILFIRLDLVIQKAGRAEDSILRPQRFAYHEIRSILESYKPTVAFLGIERASGSDSPPIERSLKRAWFAVNVDLSDEEVSQLSLDAHVMSIHPRILKLTRTEASIAGHARSVLAWHDRYRFCPTCGAATEIKDAGYKRICVKQDCRSKTGLQHVSDCVLFLLRFSDFFVKLFLKFSVFTFK